MDALVVLALLVTLAVLAPLVGADSRFTADKADRWWWPDG